MRTATTSTNRSGATTTPTSHSAGSPQTRTIASQKQETAARLLTLWELSIQEQLLEALRAIHAGGTHQVEITHPITRDAVATLTMTVTLVREPDYAADEVDLELTPTRAHAGSNLLWQLTLRALITLSPPEQGWDRYKDTFSTITEPGYFTARVTALETLTADHELGESEPGHSSHYTHRQHLAGCTINGKAVRALCGAYFVPTQDHEPCHAARPARHGSRNYPPEHAGPLD